MNTYGPVPIGSAAAFPSAFGLTMNPELRASQVITGVGLGFTRLNATVRSSTTSTSATFASCPATGGMTWSAGPVLTKSMFAFTASASNGAPSWNVTPSWSVNVIVMPSSDTSHPSASHGTKLPSGS